MDHAPAPPKFIDQPGRPRSKKVQLQWPFEYDGIVYSEIEVIRCTMKQWDDFWTGYADDKTLQMPCFSVPRIITDALDPDDDDAVQAAVEGFFPQRYRAAKTSQPSE